LDGALLTVDEHFFRWEQNRRCSFYLTGHSMPLFHAFAEDYLLEEVAPGRTHFTYSVAVEPRLTIRMGGPIAQTYFGSTFRKGCKGLQSLRPGQSTFKSRLPLIFLPRLRTGFLAMASRQAPAPRIGPITGVACSARAITGHAVQNPAKQ
jgi:hypothetical protein